MNDRTNKAKMLIKMTNAGGNANHSTRLDVTRGTTNVKQQLVRMIRNRDVMDEVRLTTATRAIQINRMRLKNGVQKITDSGGGTGHGKINNWLIIDRKSSNRIASMTESFLIEFPRERLKPIRKQDSEFTKKGPWILLRTIMIAEFSEMTDSVDPGSLIAR